MSNKTTATLEDVTAAEQRAAAAAAKAQMELQALQQAAADARQRADEERQRANRDYLTKLDKETPAQLTKARGAVSAALAAFDKAVITDGNTLAAYRAYIDARVAQWRLEKRLADQRVYHGMPARDPGVPGFSYLNDLNAAIGRYAMGRISDATTAAKEERTAYLSGKEVQP